MTKALKYNQMIIVLKFGTTSSMERKGEHKQGGN